jgi:hypothetical protein
MDLEASKLQTEQSRQMSQQAQAAKAMAEEGKILRGEAKDEALRTELAALPMDADDKAVEAFQDLKLKKKYDKSVFIRGKNCIGNRWWLGHWLRNYPMSQKCRCEGNNYR